MLRCALGLLVATVNVAMSQESPPNRVSNVVIDVVVIAPDVVEVHERFAFTEASKPHRFQFLSDRCASIDTVYFAPPHDQAVQATGSEPWVTVSPSTNGPFGGELVYRVGLSGGASSIPLLMPTGPLGSSVPNPVELSLTNRSAVPDLHPVFPVMHREGKRAVWRNNFAAIPSFIRVTGSSGFPCRRPVPSTSGAFFGVFFAFVGVLVLWVPLYLAWARRQVDPVILK